MENESKKSSGLSVVVFAESISAAFSNLTSKRLWKSETESRTLRIKANSQIVESVYPQSARALPLIVFVDWN